MSDNNSTLGEQALEQFNRFEAIASDLVAAQREIVKELGAQKPEYNAPIVTSGLLGSELDDSVKVSTDLAFLVALLVDHIARGTADTLGAGQ